MGSSSCKLIIEKQIEMLKEFRKYEIALYTYLLGSSNDYKEIEFYFISKEYIINFCKDYNYFDNSNEIDLLITYLEGEETLENNLILKTLLESIKYKTNIKKEFEPINNTDLIYNSNNPYIIKFNKEGSFIPLTKEMWDLFAKYCQYDIIITHQGFVNNGEIFILLIEAQNKIDCFFTLYKTKDLIYHYCFVMDTPEDTKTVVNYFKWEGHKYTARYLISICGIEIDKVKEYQKFKIKIPKYVSNIEKYDMTLFFVDSFKFDNSLDKNFKYFKINNDKLHKMYCEYSNKINSSIKAFKNNNH